MRYICLCLIMIMVLNNPAAARNEIQGPIHADVLKVIDDDTIEVRARTWIDSFVDIRVRLHGIDTPELTRSKCNYERQLASKALQETRDLIQNKPVKLTKIKYGKYAGRVLARVETAAGVDIAAHLVVRKLARTYDGGKRKTWCEEGALLFQYSS